MDGKGQNTALIPERVMGKVILIRSIKQKFIDLFLQRKMNRTVYALGLKFGDAAVAGK